VRNQLDRSIITGNVPKAACVIKIMPALLQDVVAAVFESGVAVAGPLFKPAKSRTDASREAHLSRCSMTVALALPLYEHVDRQQLIGVLEVARLESQPAPSYAFLSSLATCLQVCLRPACLTRCLVDCYRCFYASGDVTTASCI
jgi:hypothetical protein